MRCSGVQRSRNRLVQPLRPLGIDWYSNIFCDGCVGSTLNAQRLLSVCVLEPRDMLTEVEKRNLREAWEKIDKAGVTQYSQ